MTADSKPVGGSGGGAAVAPPQSKKALLELVSRLTREHIAPRAAEYDAAGTNPIDSWRVLGRDGFLASCIPTAYGGLGLDMPTYIGVIRTIARGCANTAMTVHMHSTVMRFIDALGTDAQKRRYFAEVVEHGRLFGSWGSEPAVSLSRSFLMETVVRQDRDAYVVDGVKHFCTMALGASHYMVWCALEGGTDMGKALLQVLVPADAPGIATDGKWNTLGMRATFSPSGSWPRTSTPPGSCWPTPRSAGRPPTCRSAGCWATRPSTSPPRSASRSPPRSSRWWAAGVPTRTSRPSAPSATCAPPPS